MLAEQTLLTYINKSHLGCAFKLHNCWILGHRQAFKSFYCGKIAKNRIHNDRKYNKKENLFSDPCSTLRS